MSTFGPAGTNPPISQFMTAWIARLTDLLYRQTAVRPTIRHAGAAGPEQGADILWWQCEADGKPLTFFIGAAEPSWRSLASLLSNSDVTTDDHDGRQAYLTLLAESFDLKGTAIDRGPQSKHCEIVEIHFPKSEPIRLRFVGEPKSAPPHSGFGLLLDIELPITIRFGTGQMLLQDLLALQPSSTIEFDRRVNDPVEILVNGRTVARGEAVVVRGNYGVRIIEIADRKDRLETSAASSASNLVMNVEETVQ